MMEAYTNTISEGLTIKIAKLTGLFLGLILLSILLLTTVFKIGRTVIQSALGVSWLAFVAAMILYIFYRMYYPAGDKKPVSKLQNEEDYVQSLNRYQHSHLFRDDVDTVKHQIERLNRKKSVIRSALSEKFDPSELSYGKFISAVTDVEKTFYINIRNTLNVLMVFDESEYKLIDDPDISPDIRSQKKDLYDDYLNSINKSINLNEAIIISLDKLLSEISKLNTVEIDDVNQLASMQEMNDLISQTKYYKYD
ncbi:hypothetical protein [Sporolactobacillus laevolacticus]|uniref:hypothetical protein n=1 Tax=Sporolactobacillus laevolacticus TaxID=33018 RepID=UPI0025B46352|nr:hypothetical protein [Sporolactobacillus laevolacticus]MDN3954456.1 hypothetical protein [Sporolactobacillus laevolacticus]